MWSVTATSSISALTSKISICIITFVFVCTPLSAQVVINEIMWDESQYVELYNSSGAAVNLTNWSLHNEDGLITTFATSTLAAGSYFLIEELESTTAFAADHLSPLNLSITGNILILKNGSGNTIDTANQAGGGWFAGVQFLGGISMERINPSLSGILAANWADSSGSGGGRTGTPKAVNSVFAVTEPVFLITRVNFKNNPDWVEIRCLDDGNGGGGCDLTGYYLTDMANPDKVVATGQITSGETLRITYNSNNADENFNNDSNQNGYIDLYTTINGLISTDEQVVFVDAADAFLDAVCWSDGVLTQAEADDLNELFVFGQWQSDLAADCINSQLVTAGYIIERRNQVDTNSAADWEISALGSSQDPGNQIQLNGSNPKTEIKDFKISRQLLWLDHSDRQKRQTTISFTLDEEAKTTAVIYDSMGRLVRRLKKGETIPCGTNEIKWRGRNETDTDVTVGIYLLYLKISNASGAAEKKATIVVGRKH